MNNKIIISIIVVLGVLVLGATFFYSGNKEVPTLKKDQEKNTELSFADFVKNGGSYKCMVDQSVEGGQTSGIAYIKDGMIKGDYNTKTQGFNVDTKIIVRDGFTYTWSSLSPGQGFKVPVVASGDKDSSTSMSSSYSFDADKIGEYDCQPWDGDSSVFELPSGVVFQEI